MDDVVKRAINALGERETERSVTPLELLLELASANPEVAHRLAHHGLTIDLMRSALPA